VYYLAAPGLKARPLRALSDAGRYRANTCEHTRYSTFNQRVVGSIPTALTILAAEIFEDLGGALRASAFATRAADSGEPSRMATGER
jgi:hypothetical protein